MKTIIEIYSDKENIYLKPYNILFGIKFPISKSEFECITEQLKGEDINGIY